MARMHSRKKGKSGSTKPAKKEKPTWLQYKPKEIELLIIKYAKEGKTAAQIGTYMRDEYGVPDVKLVTGKTISKILEEKDLAPKIPDDLMALIRKSIAIRNHLEENKQDMTAKRGLQLTESKIFRLAGYYKKNGKLPKDWKYDPEKVKLVVQE